MSDSVQPIPVPTHNQVFCTNCGNPVSEQAVACMSCGAKPTGHKKFCRQCGVALNPEQVVCTKCGAAITSGGFSGGSIMAAINNVSQQDSNFFVSFWKRAFDFSGRTRRQDFWLMVLVNFVVGMIPIVNLIYGIVAIIPGIAMAFRRLHDTGRSALWLLLLLIPLIGAIVILIFDCLDSQPGTNKWGPNPKGIGN